MNRICQGSICAGLLCAGLLFGDAHAQAQFSYYTNGGALTLTRYTGSGGDVVIPESVGGLPVARISSYAFTDCVNVTSVSIPTSVTEVGESAFRACSNLTRVTLPESVRWMNSGVFLDCARLAAITLPESLLGIYANAFGNCTALTNITIPERVYVLSERAFDGCENMIEIRVDPRNEFYHSVDGVVFSKPRNWLMCCPRGKAGHYAVPAGVPAIYNYAFFQCARLTSVSVPTNVSWVGPSAFSSCTNLGSIVLPMGIGSIQGGTFANCRRLTSIVLPDTVTNIGRAAFEWCSELASITLPGRLQRIENEAFRQCANLTAIHCEGECPALGTSVFWDVEATVYFLPGSSGWGSSFGGLPTAHWWLPYPLMLKPAVSPDAGGEAFGFAVSWATNESVVVEACADLRHLVWEPIHTNTLVDGVFHFTDSSWKGQPARLFRLRAR